MTIDRVQIKLQAKLDSALHIAGPGRTVALTDSPIELDSLGYPLLPASSVRGRIRVHLERLLKTWGEPVCTPPVSEQTCPHIWHGADPAETERLRNGYCMACRIFGSSWYDAGTYNSDLVLIENQREDPELLRMERTSVTVGRYLGTAQSGKLFSVESTTPTFDGRPLTFEGSISGRLTREEVGWLLAAISLITHAGGNKSRGMGALSFHASAVQWRRAGEWVEEAKPTEMIEEVLADGTE